MKTSNWIAFGILTLASVVLLGLYFVLGFYLIDFPIDLVLTVVWWAVIAACIFLIHRVEKENKERLRAIEASSYQ